MQTWIPDAWLYPDAEQLGPLRDILAYIADYLERVRASDAAIDPETFEYIFGDAAVVLAITGERGGGKSSLLGLMCQSLMDEGRDIVVPTLRPEMFSTSDTLVSALLSALWASLSRERPGEPEWLSAVPDQDRAALGRACLSAARNYAISQTPASTLNLSANAAMDYAEETLLVSRSTTRAHRELASFISGLLAHAPTASHPLVVVPIDDADLAPAQIGRILNDLRFLAAIPGVVPVACFDFADLRTEWLAARSAGVESRTRPLSERLERELEKLFPQRARFAVPALTLPARRRFTPIGEEESLVVRWRRFVDGFEAVAECETTLKWVVDDRPLPQGLTSPLPSTPRSLIQLWEALDVRDAGADPLRSADEAGEQARLLDFNRAMGLLINPFRYWCADQGIAEPYVTIERAADTASYPLATEVQLPELAFGISADRLFPEDSSAPHEDATTYLRSVNSVYLDAIVPPVEQEAGIQPRARRLRLSIEAASALLAVQDVLLATDAVDQADRTAYAGVDEWRFLQRTPLEDGANVEALAMFPCGASLGDIADLTRLWNAMAEFYGHVAPTRALLASTLRICAAYVERRHVDVDELCSVEASAADYQDALKQVTNVYRSVRDRKDARSAYFVAWFEELLPLQWHTSVFEVSRVREYVAGHAEVRRPFSERRHSPDDDAVFRRDDFDRVLRIYLASDSARAGLAGYEEVAAAISSRYAARLSRLAQEGPTPHVEDHSPLTALYDAESPDGLDLLERALRALDRYRAS